MIYYKKTGRFDNHFLTIGIKTRGKNNPYAVPFLQENDNNFIMVLNSDLFSSGYYDKYFKFNFSKIGFKKLWSLKTSYEDFEKDLKRFNEWLSNWGIQTLNSLTGSNIDSKKVIWEDLK